MINHRALLAKYLRAALLDEIAIKQGFSVEEIAELCRLAAEPEPFELMSCEASRQSIRKRGTRLPRPWNPDAKLLEECRGMGVDPKRAVEDFTAYWWALPGQKAVKLDWDLTFKVRCRFLADKGMYPAPVVQKSGVRKSNISGTW